MAKTTNEQLAQWRDFRDFVQDLLHEIVYKPGWSLELLYDDKYAQAVLQLSPKNTRGLMSLRVAYDGTGSYGAEPWTGRIWPLTHKMKRTEVVYTAFKAVMAAEEHETREFFKYKGVEVCGPHMDVEDLVILHRTRQLHHDVREDAMQGV